MSKRLSTLMAIVFALVSIGLSPAYALDERVIDVVAVTWNGAATALSNPATVAEVIDKEVNADWKKFTTMVGATTCLLYTSPSPRDRQKSRMPSSA